MPGPNAVGVYAKYRLKLKGGDWNPDSGTTHAVVFGRTVCGIPVRSLEYGWERQDARYSDASYVECGRCRRVLDANKRY